MRNQSNFSDSKLQKKAAKEKRKMNLELNGETQQLEASLYEKEYFGTHQSYREQSAKINLREASPIRTLSISTQQFDFRELRVELYNDDQNVNQETYCQQIRQ